MSKVKKELCKKNKQANLQVNQNSFIGRRGLAFIIDYFITNRLSILVTAIVYGFMNQGKIEILKNFNGIPANQIVILLLSVLMTHGFYFIYVPAKMTNGATMMQKVLQVRVVKEDGQKASIKDFAWRYFVGCLLVEGLFYDAFKVIVSGVCYGIFHAPDLFTSAINVVSATSSLISLGYAFKDRGRFRLFHDKISKTIMQDVYQEAGKIF
ncbi:RDD family protein [Bulleidia sp. zg-1006]|uniref:RDD family protein n=1 Tax=Bulleidia sp. zg-1006 TaxID=2806552 RepID=UPI00193A3F70|nr:RDD family protein [Bulleidia sp. zg-1006]QRG86485.1 RDD family protein [Bulleidia sp. zg-1006]